ncbi:hypothetical protein GK047_09970 [Paenibacillus sp. SYP-B3998]|uniref:Uncharacterized protein n=1 Tax=Paenibacillus sp. SYP-B3998 TaxID=2678564 RepID=A0A6G3ZXM6_9BACL|nr:hypothetical protein [Paenibacillus sp. SYP-B3998]NEW06339.1 hypothetical protein [Paenibacillus sp. SYP-B3998]
MTIRTKYVNEMNGVKADEELKKTIISQVISRADGSLTVAHNPRSKVTIFIVTSVIIFIIAIGIPLIYNGAQDSSGLPNLYKGLVVTAYAADGTSVAVSPDVDFPLGQYSLIMSSMPGFPLTIACKDADNISLRTSEGMLLLWNPPVNKVLPMGKEANVKSGTTIYWTPLVEGDRAEKAILEITAYKDKNKLGSSLIEIKTEDHIMYKGKLTYK